MPLLLRVESGTRERIEANRLMAFLQWFDPLPETVRIPSNSILRESTLSASTGHALRATRTSAPAWVLDFAGQGAATAW